MKIASKTTNPLHLEDLEPHRFEDLVRQLAYGFRAWDRLEAVGRSGSDEGFDIRGLERMAPEADSSIDEDEDAEAEEPLTFRTWLIQCKREKAISPKKLLSYLEDTVGSQEERPDCILFALACDVSKRARDLFFAETHVLGLVEAHIWSRSEIEDLLFRPENDHLLFAYFGISNVIRQRSLRTQLRARLATKRKAIRCLGAVSSNSFKPVLLRDPGETMYPYSGGIPDFKTKPRWRPFYFVGHEHNGLKFLVRRFMAYLAEDGVHYDYIEKYNQARPHDPWEQEAKPTSGDRSSAYDFWCKLPPQNKGWFEVIRVVPYDSILAIDEDGDDWFREPHLYVPFKDRDGPFAGGAYVRLTTASNSWWHRMWPKEEERIEFFPSEFPMGQVGEDAEQERESKR